MGPRFRRMHRSAPKGLSLQAQERSDKTQAKPATERKARQARGVQGIPGTPAGSIPAGPNHSDIHGGAS